MTFEREFLIRFQHCDPAGIVFYPRYFEMFNEVIEDWFAEALEMPFQRLHIEQGLGVPIVRADCSFLQASRIGDRLQFSLAVEELGRSSIQLTMRAARGEEVRLDAHLTLVCVVLGDELRSHAIPDDLRHSMLRFVPVPTE